MDAKRLAQELITQAEAIFGRITSEWSYTGIGFSESPPHLLYDPKSAGVSIILSHRAKDDDLQLVFQLAHEVCHLLYPSVTVNSPLKPCTTVLNEGISTFFSIIAIARYFDREEAFKIVANLKEHSPEYHSAYLIVSTLLEKDIEAVRKIRRVQPMINDLTKREVEAALPDMPEAEISTLLKLFNRP
jgi:hypothetical protein